MISVKHIHHSFKVGKKGRENEIKVLKDVSLTVEKGEIVATVEGQPIQAQIRGTIRGLLPTGTIVCSGMKSGDVDPRCCMDNCYTVSDKARAVGGGVLEAILMLREANHVSENG